MEQLRAAAEASKATAEMVKDPSIVTGSKDTLIDQEMGKIEDAAAHAEETKIVSDEKEEQVNEIETLLEDAKDQLEEGKAQLADENTLTPEMEALQKQIDELQGALTDAKVEHEESLLASAEASQAQATMMQAEIDRLNALLAAQPQVADVVTEYIDAYEDDLIIANQDIADAEAAVQDAQENVALEAQVASQASDDIAQTQPFYVRHRNILLLGGAAAVGAGLWWWMRQRSAQPALTANEGYYNLPEPKSPRHPSGL
jgi:chromosome segregation ATPase